MAKRAARPRSDLPQTQEALAVLLRTVERHLQIVEPAVRRQAMRLQSLQDMLDDPKPLTSQLDLQRRLGEASRRHWAEGGPSFDILEPYVDAGEMRRLFDRRQRVRHRMDSLSKNATRTSRGLRSWLNALGDLVRVDGDIVAVFQRLQGRVLHRLEEVGADTRADTLRRIARFLPRNHEITRLYLAIENAQPTDSSEGELALDFTHGDAQRAQTLLRGVRRYRQRLRQRG